MEQSKTQAWAREALEDAREAERRASRYVVVFAALKVLVIAALSLVAFSLISGNGLDAMNSDVRRELPDWLALIPAVAIGIATLSLIRRERAVEEAEAGHLSILYEGIVRVERAVDPTTGD